VPVSLEQYTKRIADCGLMSADSVTAVINGLPADKRPADGEGLARVLIKLKKLTTYQAQELYSGRGKSLVLGNYFVLDKLGQGGMGMVLKAEHRRMKRLVALKVLSPAITKTREAMRRFQREVEAAAKLTHPNIVIAFDADEAGGTHFLVMEYVDGSDLSSMVKKSGPMDIKRALQCILQAARGLEFAHEHGVVHRDIKPANLLLDQSGTVRILDLGLARLESAGAQQDELTGTGQIMGTVDYMAPEQAMNTKRADARADIYSLGITFWYLITGRAMYGGDTAIEKLMAHQTQPIPPLTEQCDGVSPELQTWFETMVAKSVDSRFQSMSEVITAIETLLAGPGSAQSSPSTGGGSKSRSTVRTGGTTTHKATATKAAPVGNLDVTVDTGLPHGDTDPQTQQGLPEGMDWATQLDATSKRATQRAASGRRSAKASAKTSAKKPPLMLIGGGAVAAIVVMAVAGFMLFGRKPAPKATPAAAVNVPPEGSADIVTKTSEPPPSTPSFPSLPSPPVTPPVSPPITPPAQTPGWQSLFNGQNLYGWSMKSCTGWTVENGELVGRTTNPSGWLMSDAEYGDFELQLEFKLSPGSNSGVFLRAWPEGAASGAEFHEIQLLDDSSPQFVKVRPNTRTGSLFGQLTTTNAPATPAGEWHRMRITCQGNRVHVVLNDVPILDGDLPADKPTRGRLGLQLYPTQVSFRNLRVRTLDGGRPGPPSPTPGGAVDLLAAVDPAKDTRSGDWRKVNGVLHTPPQENGIATAVLYLPYPGRVPDEYDVELVIERKMLGGTGMVFGFVSGGYQATVMMDSYSNPDRWGIENIDGDHLKGPLNTTANQGSRLPLNQRKTVLIQVRRTDVRVKLEGEQIVNWQGRPDQLSTNFWKVDKSDSLFVGSQARFAIHAIRMTPLLQ